MFRRRLARVAIAALLCACASPLCAADDVTLFRLFLKDGQSLVSYGEYARVDDRVIFSMPIDSSPAPALQLVNIAADSVDWPRTDRYGYSVRATRYIESRAEDDYANLTDDVARALNEVSSASSPAVRLAIVERARARLAEWPKSHYNYRENDVRQMLMVLDEALAGLRAAAGAKQFDLSLVAFSDAPPPIEQPLPKPTPKESIEQILTAARLVETPTERTALLGAAVNAIDRAGAAIPADWASGTRASAAAEIETEIAADRDYRALTQRTTNEASRRAKLGDVRGLEQLSAQVRNRDEALGFRRPDAVRALLAEVDYELDAARRLRLARDRWALRAPALWKYRDAMVEPLSLFAALRPSLENIKSLAGSSPANLADIHQKAAAILKMTRKITPPDEARAAHALLVSAAQMADHAADIRLKAALAADMARAWDASSAAAGALMLGAQARGDIQAALRRPELR